MKAFGLNLLLAVTWVALSGTVSLGNLLIGFVLGYAALWVIQPMMEDRNYTRRAFAWVRLVLYFVYDLIVSSFEVALDVLTPRHRARPAILTMPLDVKSNAGILVVTNLISLTPGTLSLDVSEDRSALRIHAMFAGDPDALRAKLKGGIERLVIEALEK